METSSKGRAFIRAHEGSVRKAYLDPVNVPTIGIGFTMRSPAVRKALAKLGINKLVPGKTKLTDAQIDAVFAEVLAEEFDPAVTKGMPAAKQNEHDAGASVSYNLGTGAIGWRWADLWRSGEKKAAAAHLASNYNTAKGKKLPGLVRRRKEEALLLLTGKYTGVETSAPEGTPRLEAPEAPKRADPVVKEAQDILNRLGIPVEIDGWYGPKTRAAVLAYQKMHPHLTADGVLGPATLSQLRRDITAAKDAAAKGIPTIVSTGAGAWAAGLPWGWLALAAGIVVVGYFAWRYRDVLQRRWRKMAGGETK